MGSNKVCFFADGLSEMKGFEENVIVKIMNFAEGPSEMQGLAAGGH